MNYKYAILIYIFSSILYTQENIPFDVSKQFAVPIENNQLLWNDDKSFNKLLIDRSSRNFKNKFTNPLVFFKNIILTNKIGRHSCY